MNWEAAGAIGEILGAIVVAVTLIYLAVQTHLNKKATEALAVSNCLDTWNRVHEIIIQSEEIALLLEKGQRYPDTLTKAESIRFFFIVRETISAYAALYTQYRNGLIDEQTWSMMRFDVYVSQPGVRRFLEDQVHFYGKGFTDYISTLEEFTAADPVFTMTGGRDNDT